MKIKFKFPEKIIVNKNEIPITYTPNISLVDL